MKPWFNEYTVMDQATKNGNNSMKLHKQEKTVICEKHKMDLSFFLRSSTKFL